MNKPRLYFYNETGRQVFPTPEEYPNLKVKVVSYGLEVLPLDSTEGFNLDGSYLYGKDSEAVEADPTLFDTALKEETQEEQPGTTLESRSLNKSSYDIPILPELPGSFN